jgi:hypothetical protein
LVRQRVFGLVAGYLDGNDAARLADDPLHKLVLDREPLTGPALGSQPTLSRFENGIGRRDLVRLGQGLARAVIAHHRRRLHGRARRITIDLDPTDDPTHGQQELSFFNGHYDTACYLPLVATLTFDDESIQYLVGIVLRPGNAAAGRGVIGRLRWLLRALRQAFPRAILRVRLDGGFAGPRLLTCLDRAGVEYLVGLPGNPRLAKRIRRLLGRARVLFRTTGQPTALFGETRYAARSWRRKRRVIMKAEVVQYPGRAPRDNPRFVVTNLPLPPEGVYALYRQRGDVENRHKELTDKSGAGADQLSALPGQPGPRLPDRHGLHPLSGVATAGPGDGLRRRPGGHAPGTADQAGGLDHALGAPDRAASAARLSVAQALAAGRPGGRGPGRLTATPRPLPARTPAGMVSLPDPPTGAPLTRSPASPVGTDRYLGHVDLRASVRCVCGVHQGRATHVVRAFTNRSG